MFTIADAAEILRAVRDGAITQERQGQWWRPAHMYRGETIDHILRRLDDLVLVELSNTSPPVITERGLEVLEALGPDGEFTLQTQRGR